MKKIFNDSDYPVKEIFIDEDDNTGIRLISLVQDPAIMVQGMAFNSESNKKDYQFKNIDDKQMVVGPALIPGKKILRYDEDDEPYYIFFSEATIKLMVEKFTKGSNAKYLNIDHTSTMLESGYIQQSWIIDDSYYDKSKTYGYSLPKGTYFIEVKIDDKDEWNTYVKEGGMFSFSVEGLMGEKSHSYKRVGGVNTHKNCKCRIIGGEWVINGGDTCQMCLDAQDDYNTSKLSSMIDELNEKEIKEIISSL